MTAPIGIRQTVRDAIDHLRSATPLSSDEADLVADHLTLSAPVHWSREPVSVLGSTVLGTVEHTLTDRQLRLACLGAAVRTGTGSASVTVIADEFYGWVRRPERLSTDP